MFALARYDAQRDRGGLHTANPWCLVTARSPLLERIDIHRRCIGDSDGDGDDDNGDGRIRKMETETLLRAT